MTHTDNLISAAIDYAQRGLSVLPAHHVIRRDGVAICSCGKQHGPYKNGKHPALRGGWIFYQNHVAHPMLAEAWMTEQYKGYNLCVIHGPVSGTCVLDFDGEEGMASRRKLEAELGALPATPTIITGGGGLHEIYKHPGTHIPTNAGLREGFDVRCDGGMSMMPPSIHESGREYMWECDASLEDLPLADLPDNWVKFIQQSVSSSATSSGIPTIDKNVKWQSAPDGSRIVTDGRETFMRDVVWAELHSLTKANGGQKPDLQTLYTASIQAYMPYVDTGKPGRGEDEVLVKCKAALQTRNFCPRGLTKPFLKG